MKKKNNVIFKLIRFVDNKSPKRNYYTSGKYLKYIMREEATLVDSTGLYDFKKNEEYSFEEVNNLKEKFKNLNNNQIIWDCVISINKEYCEKNYISNPKEIIENSQEAIQKLFEMNNMDIDNFEIFAAFHQNTDNPHFHIGFFEKNPRYIKNGKECFNWIGAIGGKDCINFKQFGLNVEKSIENNNLFINLKDLRKELYTKTQEQLKNKYTDAFSNLISYWVDNKVYKFSYNNLSDEHKDKINSTLNMMINDDDNLKELYEKYQSKLLDIKNWYDEHNDIYKLDNQDPDDWFKLESEGINIRLSNSILKTIKPNVIQKNNEDKLIKTTAKIIYKAINEDIRIRQNKMRPQDSNYSISPISNVKNWNKNNFNFKRKKTKLLKIIDASINQQLKEAMKIYDNLQKQIQFEKERNI